MVFFDFFQNRILTVGPWQMGIVFLRSRNHASAMVGHASAMVGPGPAKTIEDDGVSTHELYFTFTSDTESNATNPANNPRTATI